jgi:hypothetical protein
MNNILAKIYDADDGKNFTIDEEWGSVEGSAYYVSPSNGTPTIKCDKETVVSIKKEEQNVSIEKVRNIWSR